MTEIFSPQFDTHSLDLNIKKGESAQFAIAITDYDLDLRDCLVYCEIRRLAPGYNLIPNFTGIVNQGSDVIQIKQYPRVEDKSRILKSLGVRVGDLITLEGSGITASKVLAVTDNQITASATATRTINEGRLLVRSLSIASFTAIPYLPIINIVLTGTAALGDEMLNVADVTRTIPSGTVLVFDDTSTAKLAVLIQELQANNTVAFVLPLEAGIGSNSVARIGAQVVMTTDTASVGALAISTLPLSAPIPSGTTLHFANRSIDGWAYGGAATLVDTALAGTTSLDVSELDTEIREGAIAWFASAPFNSFYLAIDPADTQFLESGTYGYDVIVRQPNGFTLRIMQGECKLLDHWSDGV
jgi:hypothetical protein